MTQEPLAPFYSELLGFIQKDVVRKAQEFPESAAAHRLQQTLRQALSPNSADQILPLSEIIDNYHYLFGQQGKAHIERRLMESLSIKEFADLNLSSYFPRIVRGLPRLYNKDHIAQSHIKKNFSCLPTLRKLSVDRALFSLYSKVAVRGRMALFGWVMNDGLGDYIALWEIAQLIKRRFAHLDLHLVAFVTSQAIQRVQKEASFSVHLIPYDKEPSLDLFPENVLSILRSCDLILQTPTFYAETDELIGKLQPTPKMECLGEYGFLESSWFHPRTGNRSLGLHFLEKGVLTRSIPKTHFHEIQNRELLEILFGIHIPGPLEIEEYFSKNHFYLSYLTTPVGGAVYLHALLKALERDEKGIDLCVPDIGWFVRYVEQQKGLQRPIIEGSLIVKQIELYIYGKRCVIPIGSKGKRLRLICPEKLDPADFRRLLALSGEFVAVRGDQSFSETICANKAFFYDGREHARYFLKDLLAIAQNRIGAHRGTVTCFQGMAEAFHHNLPEQLDTWVDEAHFQESIDWVEIALKIGAGLQDPDTVVGYKKLNRILVEEYSANDFICHLVQRAFCHQARPSVAALEAEQMNLFGLGLIRFKALVETLRNRLASPAIGEGV